MSICVYNYIHRRHNPFELKNKKRTSSRIIFANSMFRLNRWSWWRPSNPKYLINLRMWYRFLWMGGKYENMLQKLEKKTLKNYSEDLEFSTISMIKKGLFPSLALKTALWGVGRCRRLLFTWSPKRTKRPCKTLNGLHMCSLLVGYNVNLLDVVMSNPWRISMMALGTLGPSSRENPTYPNIKCGFPWVSRLPGWYVPFQWRTW